MTLAFKKQETKFWKVSGKEEGSLLVNWGFFSRSIIQQSSKKTESINHKSCTSSNRFPSKKCLINPKISCTIKFKFPSKINFMWAISKRGGPRKVTQ
jgi:hypothetical protein